MKFYNLTKNELEKELNTNFSSGLSEAEAENRSFECSNDNSTSKFHVERLKFTFFKSSVFVLLSVCAFILTAIFTKDFYQLFNSLAIALIALMGGLCFYFYILFLNKRINSYNKNSFSKLEVLREDKKNLLKYDQILYGDVVYLKKGDFIPFDAYIIESESLLVDEYDVTSRGTVEKRVGVISDLNAPITEAYNMVFSGSYVISGHAKVVVTDVGKRVYVSKIHKQKTFNKKYATKITDFSKLLLFVFCLLAVVFTVICSFLSGNYVNAISSILIFFSLLFSDFLTKYIFISFSNTFLGLSKEKIYLKNPSVIEKINNSDLIIFNQDSIFKNDISITGFSDYNNRFSDVGEIGKNNFETFVYAALCSEKTDDYRNYSFNKSIIKILKKIGIDFKDIDSMCPMISYLDVPSELYEICGRVYDGNNLLIVKGDFNKILELCSKSKNDIPEDVLNKLYSDSTEVIGVAIKNVDIIPDDLSEQTDAFTLLGFISVKKSIRKDTAQKISELLIRGYKSVILYSGNKISAEFISEKLGLKSFSYNTIDNLNKNDFDCGCIIYDYTGDERRLISKITSFNFKSVFCGRFNTLNQKVIYFDSFDSSAYHQKECDVVCKPSFDKYFKVFNCVDKTYSYINYIFENIITFIAIYVICGTLYTILFKKVLFNTALLSLVTFIALLIPCLCVLYCSKFTRLCDNKKFASEPIQYANMINAMLITFFFIVAIVFLKLINKSDIISGILVVAFAAYLPYLQLKNILKLNNVLSILPSIVLGILFILPISNIFGIHGFNFIHLLISICLGVSLRFLINKFNKIIVNKGSLI